ncbi:adenosylmethionine decarboxylase [Rhodoplanes serenus]|uniref:S-adenosylmethionine decarboxylase proenzyme n=1 Tax=Rhodoplanes serenus TaxID=200615 RepID=A0A9X5AS41_9BRAD|nr:adenosylmethionine decarboxylase [Rhodoplanes serenus]MTW15723.1 adenosylmethionine decarboxylase [Rhodoplanes serenus]
MRQGALLRSGKGLGLPGTARNIVNDIAAPGPASAVDRRLDDERYDHFIVRNGVHCAGAHLIIDVHGGDRLDDIEHIERTLRECVDAAGATLLHIHLHHFQPTGVSGVAVLAESHISIHTWPEVGYAALDVFMCGKAEPDACVPILREAFSAKRVVVSELLRGQGA